MGLQWRDVAHTLRKKKPVYIMIEGKSTQCLFHGHKRFVVPRLHVKDKRPGIYEDRFRLKVSCVGTKNIFEVRASSLDLEHTDITLHNTRRRNVDPIVGHRYALVRELPNTKFWEGDAVRVQGKFGKWMVVSIHYNLTSKDVSYKLAKKLIHVPLLNVSESQISLYEEGRRGNVWRLYHGQKLEFCDDDEEADFIRLLGKQSSTDFKCSGDHETDRVAIAQLLKEKKAHYALMIPFKGISLITYDCEWLGGLVRRYAKRLFDII